MKRSANVAGLRPHTRFMFHAPTNLIVSGEQLSNLRSNTLFAEHRVRAVVSLETSLFLSFLNPQINSLRASNNIKPISLLIETINTARER